MISLRGKIALITGGSRGIGLSIAHAFARHGASTILMGRSVDTLRSAAETVKATAAAAAEIPPTTGELQTPPPPGTPFHTFAQGDVRLATTWDQLVKRLDRGELEPAVGGPVRVDVLVNCAGVAQRGLLIKTSPEDVDDLLGANLKSAVLGCKYVGRQMVRSSASLLRSRTPSSPSSEDESSKGGERAGREQAGLSIINVSSVMASRGGHGASVYAASKAGVLGRPVTTPRFVAPSRII